MAKKISGKAWEEHENAAKAAKKSKVKSPKGKTKVGKVLHEFKEGELHSGSKKGPKVSNRKQAIAIALSEARKSSGIKAKPGKKKTK